MADDEIDDEPMSDEPNIEFEDGEGRLDADAVLALCSASLDVRDGQWFEGAPTHIFAELLLELEARGWVLARKMDARAIVSVSRRIVNAQAEDDALWSPQTATEAYAVQELRTLHRAVEGDITVKAAIEDA